MDLAQYRSLLMRLYGFYLPFEYAVDVAHDRSTWLRADLVAVTLGGHDFEDIPQCKALAGFDTPARKLGALYVVEGSTLGGRHLARNLGPLLGSRVTEGRRFFLGRGSGTASGWNVFLARLTAAGSTPAACDEIVEAAVMTFSIFEEWLRNWSDVS
jgi:heme oxygenase